MPPDITAASSLVYCTVKLTENTRDHRTAKTVRSFSWQKAETFGLFPKPGQSSQRCLQASCFLLSMRRRALDMYTLYCILYTAVYSLIFTVYSSHSYRWHLETGAGVIPAPRVQLKATQRAFGQSVIASPCASLRARLRRSSRSWLRAAAALQNWSQPAATVLQCCCTVLLYCCTVLLLPASVSPGCCCGRGSRHKAEQISPLEE